MNSSGLVQKIAEFQAKMQNYHTSIGIMSSPDFSNAERADIMMKRGVDLSEFACIIMAQAILPLIVMDNGDIEDAKDLALKITSAAIKEAEAHARALVGPSKE